MKAVQSTVSARKKTVTELKEPNKVCKLCKRELPASSFKFKERWRVGTCRECDRVIFRVGHSIGRYHRGDRSKYPISPRAKEKKDAQNILHAAVRYGKIKKQNCQECGSPNTDGHHDDYSRPLEVRWLCRNCHMKLHRKPTGSTLTEGLCLQAPTLVR